MVSFRKTVRIIAAVALTSFSVAGYSQEAYTPQNGDLLFQEGNTGDFEEAIKAVTPAWKGKQLTHVGTVYIHDGKVMVIEAISKGVVETSYADFLNRELDELGRPKVLAGRLKPEFKAAAEGAISKMLPLIGKKYDKVFDINNDSYYCSELIYKCFTDKNSKPIFKLSPMTFADPSTGILFEKWRTYFEALNTPVPEGKPGLNPGSMANEPVVDIIYSFY